ncbi:Rieske (2Fe-2S) protein [Chitinimonas taiwanensis]|uniref:Ferredoxin subunit of nitrite reductase or a ring-hydroxylating dioxygenase n=1 Tax=Chitinimonas taiwanensis DSM 18899 TaxID=1121279 RepID=A0A1K2H7S2_9NEIS|nr:Rieske 2Fe-2S domain-containing protein [Chitinimonas taiwanensis]SFZ72673.1 Ferredoxin subunit of nitrite reductase or a ring-hydroxylating dioxygenase [Chitinimonas taiwanensis DSM 18899]
MAERRWRICASEDLPDAGLGVRFQAEWRGVPAPAFAVRWAGKVQAYLNECAHIPIELDFNEGDFFDLSRSYLICSTHGAYYRPDTGLCLGGPCKGARLTKLAVLEEAGEVFFLPDAQP